MRDSEVDFWVHVTALEATLFSRHCLFFPRTFHPRLMAKRKSQNNSFLRPHVGKRLDPSLPRTCDLDQWNPEKNHCAYLLSGRFPHWKLGKTKIFATRVLPIPLSYSSRATNKRSLLRHCLPKRPSHLFILLFAPSSIQSPPLPLYPLSLLTSIPFPFTSLRLLYLIPLYTSLVRLSFLSPSFAMDKQKLAALLLESQVRK